MITIDLSKQQALDTDPRATHQISFTRNLDLAAGDLILFILEEAKKNSFRHFTRNCKSYVNALYNNLILFNIKST